ncbi:MAG TPA: hypothetical protein VJH20_05400 [Candidatus Nanoarchaeia archaeon]|nr:hypothetical protein [Candidatus Nanoarchaeia archaeon]
MVDRIPWEKGSKSSKEEDSEEQGRKSRILKKLGVYVGSTVLALAAGLYGGYSLRGRDVIKAKQEISQLEGKLEEQKTVHEAAINYTASLSDSLHIRNATIDSLNSVNRKFRVDYGKAIETNEYLRGDIEFYMTKVDSLVDETGRLNTLVETANVERAALGDFVNNLNEQIKAYDLKLQESQDEITRFKLLQEESKPQEIKLPGEISTRFNYYVNNGDNAGGLTISKSLGKSNIIDTAFEGGFNVFEGRDTGQFLGFRLSLDLLERFRWDFSSGPYIFRDFSDGAKAKLNLYGESGFYFEPFGKVKGLGLRVSVRNIEDRVDYSAALELGRR